MNDALHCWGSRVRAVCYDRISAKTRNLKRGSFFQMKKCKMSLKFVKKKDLMKIWTKL